MQLPMPSEADKKRFRTAVLESPDVEQTDVRELRCCRGPAIGVKLFSAGQQDLEADHQTQPCVPKERPTGDYIGDPREWQDNVEKTAKWMTGLWQRGRGAPQSDEGAGDRARTQCSYPRRPRRWHDPKAARSRESRYGL